MESVKISDLYDLTQSLAGEALIELTYPWEMLPKIKELIPVLGEKLDPAVYEKKGENIWIARSAKIASTASITGPVIIGEDTEVRPGAFIRGNALVGNDCVVGNSTELKNVILFNNVQHTCTCNTGNTSGISCSKSNTRKYIIERSVKTGNRQKVKF